MKDMSSITPWVVRTDVSDFINNQLTYMLLHFSREHGVIVDDTPETRSKCTLSLRVNPISNISKTLVAYQETTLGGTAALHVPLYTVDPLPPRVVLTGKGGAPPPLGTVQLPPLRPAQVPYADAMHDAVRSGHGGLLVLPTGFGKTVISMHVIARAGLRSAVVVHRSVLQTQWQAALDLHGLSTTVTVVTVQAMAAARRRGEPAWSPMGDGGETPPPDLVIVDEVHTMATSAFSQCFLTWRPTVLFGLSATPTRTDGAEAALGWYFGPILHDVPLTARKTTRTVVHRVVNDTEYDVPYLRTGGKERKINFSGLMVGLASCPDRTALIEGTVQHILDARPDAHILVVSRILRLLDALQVAFPDAVSLRGKGGKKARVPLQSTDTPRLVLASMQVVKEGFNLPCLNTLVLGLPMSDIVQVLGRVYRRDHPMVEVYDVVDTDIPMCGSMWRKRRAQYMDQLDQVSFITQ